MERLESEKKALTKLLEQSPEPPALRLHPSLSDLYRTKIRNLASNLRDPDLKTEATEASRGLISEIRLVPDVRAPNGHHIELAGELAGILALGDAEMTKPAASAGLWSETVVAGGRSELNLRGSQDKLVAGKRNQLNLLIFAPDFSAWRYAS